MTSRFRALLLLAVIPPLIQACSRTEAEPTPAPPPSVAVVEVMPETVPVSAEWVATLDGYVNAQIRPQVSGYLIRQNYPEGAAVRKGEVLFEIDPRTFDAAVAQADAQLAGARAELGRTERDVQRDTPLAKERAIAQSQLETEVQANLAAQATVKSAEAALETARLNLGFTKVRSLIDGVAAIATAQIGDLVGPTTLLTTVSQVDPIRAYFSLSEREYLLVASRINRATPSKELFEAAGGLRLRLADGSEYPQPGVFVGADRQIDPRTGTIRISAAFPNPSHILRPGQYGRVEATTQTLDNALLVPQRAVTELQGTSQLRVVGADNKLRVVNVTMGPRLGNRWVVSKGLEPGARVALDAPQIQDNTLVNPRPFTEGEPAPASQTSGD
jgi:RND family efflux transporter MFP subunit